MTRAGAAGVAVLLVVGLAVGLATVGLAAGGEPAAGVSAVQTGSADFDRTIFEITVYANGSATWTLEHRQHLDNESEVEQFRSFAAEFRENETSLYRNFVSGAEVLTANASAATGREMEARAFSRDARVAVDVTHAERGVVEMTFLWTNFAAQEGDRLVVSDVFDEGPYLGPDQRMDFVAGPDVEFRDASPRSYGQTDLSIEDSDSIWWDGEIDFDRDRPRVEFAVVDDGGSQVDGGFMLLIALVVVAVSLAGAAAWHSGGPGEVIRTLGGGDGDGGAAAGGAAGSSPVTEEELLSDSDRVVKLLEENGGRMKQVNIVDETDWSKSKVSMLLSDMEEEGEISKLRVGRENIVSLAGHEPDAAGSPFEDES